MSPVEQTIWDFLTIELKLNTASASGVKANIQTECSYRPSLAEKKKVANLNMTSDEYNQRIAEGLYTREQFISDRVGYGICQWTHHDRKAAMWEYFKNRSKPLSDLPTQLKFMSLEMSKSLITKLRNMPDTEQGAYEAAYLFCMKYERPAGGEQSAKKRGELAKSIYAKMKTAI